MTKPRVTIQTEDFDLSTEVAALRAEDPAVGAVASLRRHGA
jgi:molybdopterin synthase catalytic subunit